MDHMKRRSGVFGDGTHPRYKHISSVTFYRHDCFTFFKPNVFHGYYLRSHLGSSSDLRYSMVEGQDSHYSTTVIRRAQKGRLSALRDDPNKVSAMSYWDLNNHHVIINLMIT